MEELALCTQPLHHIYTLSTEEAHIAAADVDRELFSEGALWENKALISFYNKTKQKNAAERRLRYIKDLRIHKLTHQVIDNVCLLLS